MDGYDIILLRRGDANNDGVVNISDAYFINDYLFMGGYAPACMDAADVNDDGWVDLADSSYLSNWLYQGGPMPPAPGPFTCGQDSTADSLTCQSSICH